MWQTSLDLWVACITHSCGVLDNHITNSITLTTVNILSSVVYLCMFVRMKGKLFCAIDHGVEV